MTPRQRDLLVFISAYQRERGGVSPSVQEMADHLRLKSKSGVHQFLDLLEADAYVRRGGKHRARCITVLRQPEPQISSEPLLAVRGRTATVDVPLFSMRAVPTTDRYPFLSHRTCAEWSAPR
jgi:repressor LexA